MTTMTLHTQDQKKDPVFPFTRPAQRVLGRRWRRAESLKTRAKRAAETLRRVEHTLPTQTTQERRRVIIDALCAAIYLDTCPDVGFRDLEYSPRGWKRQRDGGLKWID